MSDDRRKSLIVGNLPEETVAVLENSIMYDNNDPTVQPVGAVGATGPMGPQVAYPPNVAPPANWKENNPKDGYGVLKPCMSWLPDAVIMELAVAMAEGGFKYGGHNYLIAAPRSSVYTDAARRHIFQYETLGEEVDAESGCELSHITKAIASLVVLRAAQINGKFIDDRPPPAPAEFLQELADKMKMLAAKNPDPVARYLARGARGPGRLLLPQ